MCPHPHCFSTIAQAKNQNKQTNNSVVQLQLTGHHPLPSPRHLSRPPFLFSHPFFSPRPEHALELSISPTPSHQQPYFSFASIGPTTPPPPPLSPPHPPVFLCDLQKLDHDDSGQVHPPLFLPQAFSISSLPLPTLPSLCTDPSPPHLPLPHLPTHLPAPTPPSPSPFSPPSPQLHFISNTPFPFTHTFFPRLQLVRDHLQQYLIFTSPMYSPNHKRFTRTTLRQNV